MDAAEYFDAIGVKSEVSMVRGGLHIFHFFIILKFEKEKGELITMRH